jgi:uncharacterized protein
MLSRRNLLLMSLAGPAAGAYGVGVEPFLNNVTRYRLQPEGWPQDLKLTIAVIADLHACEPWMNLARIRHIVEMANSLGADSIALLGDYVAGHRKITAIVPDHEWAAALSELSAPLGVYAILGNHDWWADKGAQAQGHGPIAARTALERVGIPVLENDSAQIEKAGRRIWVAGLGDQLALCDGSCGPTERGRGVDNLDATLASVAGDGPVILLAHEPDIFPQVPARVALTLSGHTHGGQVRIPGLPPFANSELSRKYIYGHFVDSGRHLIVSGGLGCSWWPVRVGVPPEIVLVEIGSDKNLAAKVSKAI